MQGLTHNLKLGVRMLARTPGFTLIAVATLALGIGANTAIFTVVDNVLLRPAPIAGFDRLAMIWETDRHSGTTREPASVPDYLDFAARSRAFETLAAIAGTEVNLAPAAGDPFRLAALNVTHGFLPALGIAPVAGRSFTEEEDRAGGPNVAMISESLWERSYGRDPAALGETIRLDETPFTIVGVAPDVADFGILQVLSAAAYSRSFADQGGSRKVDVWMPMQADPKSLPRDTHPIFVIGRLAPMTAPGAAQQELAAIAADLERTYPQANAGRGVNVEPLERVVFGPTRPALLVLLGAVALVLLVACANVANLLLARGAGRAREVAVRAALGAGVAHLAAQFFAENLVLVLVAAAAGTGIAYLGLDALLALAPADVPRLASIAIDLRVLAATAAVSILAGLVFGTVPTLQARRLDLLDALRSGGGPGGSEARGRGRVRSGIVVAEMAMAVVLVAGAGLLLKSFWRLLSVDPGFHSAGVLKAEYQLPKTRYPADFKVWPNFKEMHAFNGALLARVQALPGVESASLAGNHPLDPGFTNSFSVVGREEEARSWPEISIRRVTAGYFRTVGLPLVRGRLLRDSDTTAAVPVLLINRTAAGRFFPGQDPLGQKISFWGSDRTIVGVIADERSHGLSEPAPIAAYLPLSQCPSVNGDYVLLARTSGDPAAQSASLRRAVREIDPALAVFGVETLDEVFSRSVAQRRFTMMLVGLFASIALALAAVGVYGVLAYAVTRRTREIGIRLALGAPRHGILRLVVGHGMTLIGAGLALGLGGALALSRVMRGLLFDVTATDPTTLASVGLAIVTVGLAACLVPALRALRVEPAEALRSE